MPHKLFIFVPAFGQQITATTFMTTHSLQAALGQNGIVGGITTLSFPDIAELRSMAVTVWYDTMPDTTHILFIDADMGFPPQLVLEMLSFGEPVVGTIYPQRKYPQSWAGSGTGEPMTERRGNFMKVEGVGMGCTLIHRSAIDTMLERMPELVDTRIELHPARDMIRSTGANRLIRCFEKLDLPERGVVSEDLSFCLRWGQCGGTVWANVGHKISHVGQHDFAARYLDVIEQAQAQGVAPADVFEVEKRAKAVDPIFTPIHADAMPMPGTAQEMPGGPLHRKQGAVLAGDLSPIDPAEDPNGPIQQAALAARQALFAQDPETYAIAPKGNGLDALAPKRKRGRPRKAEKEAQAAA